MKVGHCSVGQTMTTIPTFVERESYEEGFAKVFEREIVPVLYELDQKRIKRLRQLIVRLIISVIGIVVGGIYGWHRSRLLTSGGDEWWVLVIFGIWVAGIVVCAVWVFYPGGQHGEDLQNVIVGPVCRFFGDLEHTPEPNSDHFDHRQFRSLGMIENDYNRAEFKDIFVGRYRDVGFQIVDGDLVQRRLAKGASQLVFRGLLLIFDVPKLFVDRLYKLGHRVVDERFFFTFPSETRFFQPSSIFRSVYRCEQDIHMILKGVNIAHQVIDYIHGDKPGLRLPGWRGHRHIDAV